MAWILRLLVGFTLLSVTSRPVQAQWWRWFHPRPATIVIASTRRIDWTTVGATITTSPTQCGSTIAAYAGTGATIQAAITACTAGQYVLLGSGTFTLSTGFALKAGVTLRGAGADATFLIFTGGAPVCLYSSVICLQGGNGNYGPNPENTAAWTAGYVKGATTVTLDNVTNLAVGDLLLLDQLDDTDTDTGEIWICKTLGVCSSEGATDFGRTSRNQIQTVRVVGVAGADVTITPGLYMPNWRSGRSPGAWWSTTAPLTLSSLEDLSIDAGASGISRVVFITNARECWIRGVRFVGLGNDVRCFVCIYGAAHITVRDNYIYGTASGAAQHYGFETVNSSDLLIENNITESVTIPLTSGQSSAGVVWGYNYSLNDTYTLVPNWMQASAYHHAVANQYHLFEGNDGIGLTADAIHGASQFSTTHRSYLRGYDPEGGSVGGKTQQTIAIHLYAFNRYFNIVGNVLGEDTIHTAYEGYPAATDTLGPDANMDHAIYMLGWSANQSKNTNNPVPGLPNDPLVRTTLLRWFNYDEATNTTRCDATESPAGISPYGNPVPGTCGTPASLYYMNRPAWYVSAFGSVTWPPIGPDVTGTFGPGNHVTKIPARLCYEHMVDDATYTGLTVRVFSRATCY